jgi:cephalosporin hydroxylase
MFDKEGLDFVLLDGDHTHTGIKNDLEAWYPKIKKGGYIFIHDTNVLHVYQAVKDFKNDHKIRTPLLRSKNQISFWVKA